MGTRGQGLVRAGGRCRTREFPSSPEESAGSLNWRYGSRGGESAAARWRIRGVEERAPEPTGEGAGLRWSACAHLLEESPSF